jgi:hypothetical protein
MQMKKIITVVMVLTVASMLSFGVPSIGVNLDGKVDEIKNTEAMSMDIFIIADDNFTYEIGSFSNYSKKIEKYISQTLNKNAIVFVDESWLIANSDIAPSSNTIKDMICANTPMVFLNGNSYLYKDSGIGLSVENYAEGSGAYGLYYGSNGVQYVFSYYGNDMDDAVSQAYIWVNNILSEESKNANKTNSAPSKGPLNPYWREVKRYTDAFPNLAKATMSISTKYYKLTDHANDGYSYYIMEHSIQAVPKSGYKLGDIYLDSTLKNTYTLVDSDPQTTQGTTTASVSFQYGNSVGGAMSWSYGIGDVIVHNGSNNALGKLNIWHDVNEFKAVGDGFTVRPGVEIRVPNSDNNGSLTLLSSYGYQVGKVVNINTLIGGMGGLLQELLFGPSYVFQNLHKESFGIVRTIPYNL